MKEKLRSLISKVKEQESFNGVALLAVDGEILLSEAIGIAEKKQNTARLLTTNTMFELASVSKPITATAIIRLQQEGKLDLDNPISNWIPELPYSGITIRHLLNHTSGLPDYMELFAKKWNPARYAFNEDVLRLIVEHRPDVLFAPNESWEYSNTGYILLAILIERISGQSYSEYLEEAIFKPLKMDRSMVFNRRINSRLTPLDYAYGYVYRIGYGGYVLPDEIPELNYVKYLDGLQGDGMINSTVNDLLRLDRALYNDEFIIAETKELMYSPAIINNGVSINYGLGWFLQEDDRLGSIVYHTGGWPGYSTLFKRYIDRDITLILLQNGERSHSYTQQLVTSFEQIMCDDDSYDLPIPLENKNIIEFNPRKAQAFTGKYRFGDEEGKSLAVDIYIDKEQLCMKLANGMILTLLPLNSNRFFEEHTATELEFIFQEMDNNIRLLWYTNSEPEIAQRIFQ